MNNNALERAQKWFHELEVQTIATPTCLMVNRNDIDNLFGVGVIYDTVLMELKKGLDYSRYCWTYKDDNWLHLETI